MFGRLRKLLVCYLDFRAAVAQSLSSGCIMKKNFISGLFAVVLICSGCVTSSHIVTGKLHPAFTPDAVKLYAAPPEKYEVIGLVNAGKNNQAGQRDTDDTLKQLKKEAADIGANGIVLTTFLGVANATSISGMAILVP